MERREGEYRRRTTRHCNENKAICSLQWAKYVISLRKETLEIENFAFFSLTLSRVRSVN